VRTRLLAVAVTLGGLLLAGAQPEAQAKEIAGVIRDVPTGTHVRAPVLARAANLGYSGGSVLHTNRSHLIFWAPSSSSLGFDQGYVPLIETFLAQVAADSRKPTNVYGLSGQYGDSSGPAAYASTYGGGVIDTDPLPVNGCVEPAGPPAGPGPGWLVCLNDGQLQTEIDKVVATQHLPTSATDVYFLVTPNGLGSCTGTGPDNCALGGGGTGYCGYHSQTGAGILYAVIPYNAVPGHCQSDNPRPNGSTADPTISTISHEHNETITDPFDDAWTDGSGNENGDLCFTEFGPTLGGSGPVAWNEVIGGGHYYLQEEWSNDNGGCRPRDEADSISFSSPARSDARKRIRFAAHAADPDGSIVAYSWYFGAGATVGHGRVITHAFKQPGIYQVVLRTTDRAGNWAFDSRTIQVSAPRPKAAPRRR
jgi:hypothetical protein